MLATRSLRARAQFARNRVSPGSGSNEKPTHGMHAQVEYRQLSGMPSQFASNSVPA